MVSFYRLVLDNGFLDLNLQEVVIKKLKKTQIFRENNNQNEKQVWAKKQNKTTNRKKIYANFNLQV